jgi:hypothetical protein
MDQLRAHHPSLHQLLLQTAQPAAALPFEAAAQHGGGVAASGSLDSRDDGRKGGYRGSSSSSSSASALEWDPATVGFGPAAAAAAAAVPLVHTLRVCVCLF